MFGGSIRAYSSIPLLLGLLSSGWSAGPNPNLPLDRPYTLLNPRPAALESEYHRLIAGEAPQSFIFPRPCWSELDSSGVCGSAKGWGFADSAKHRELRLSPVLGYEYRYLGSNVHASDIGMIAEGATGPLSFYLDARMFAEEYADLNHAS